MGVRFKDGSYEANVMINGVRRTKRFSTKRFAEAWISDMKLRKERHGLGFASRISISEFMGEFLPYFKDHASHNGYSRMQLSMNHFLAHISGIEFLDKVTPSVIEAYKPARKAKVSENTVNRELSDIRSMFNYAVTKKYLVENPVKEVRFYKVKTKKLPRWLRDHEIKTLLALTTDTMWAFIVAGINIGLRKMELVMLEWCDIDFEDRMVYVRNKPEYNYHTKNYQPRTVPLNEDAYNALLIQRDRLAGTSRYVFPNEKGNPRKNNLLRNLKVCYKRAGITDADIHSLRHTFCTQLARKNVPVQKIMFLAGHLDIETTMLYVNLVKEDLRDSVDRLDFGLGYSKVWQNCGETHENIIQGRFSKP
ncbi:MAG: site-specific integrase [Deltaproteobacteria bacterium]|nr:site-specific integrase [Deltaproteobacteria bacterium]